jgi:hypothetical protein
MELPTGSQDSSAPSLAGLIQKNYTPGNGVNGNAPTFQNSLRINIDDPVAPPPLPVVQPQPIGYMQVPAQPRMAAPQPQLSAPAQQYANAFQNNGQPMDNGTWMQRNLQMVQAEQALKAQQQQLQPQYEQLWRDSQRAQAVQMLQQTNGSADQNSLGALWAASVLGNQNNGMMNGGQYGMTAGNQSLAQLQELQRQGINVPPQLLQAAYDQDYLWNMDGDTTSLKGIGSLQYKSMGVAGGTYTGNNSTSAYGASAFDDNGNWNQNSGANHFEFDNLGYNKQQMDEIKRGWANDARYSKDPMGSYIGNGKTGTTIQSPFTSNNQKPGNIPGISQGPIQGPTNPYQDLRGMSRDQKIDEILNSGGGRYLNKNQNVMDLHDSALDQLLKFGRGQLSSADQARLIDSQTGNGTYLPRAGQYDDSLDHPLRGVIDPPGAYEQWVPPASGYDPSQMYGAPKEGKTYSAYPALAQWSEGPEVKPLNVADPMWDVFSDDTRAFAKPPRNEQRYSNAFDRYAFDPITGGVVEGMLEKKAGKKK